MSALTDLRDKTATELANITDAGYPGDPLGTNANAAYFIANVHNFLKALGQIALPSRKFKVSPLYTGLGEPFFATIDAAYAAVSGSSSSNKQLIEIEPNAASYSEGLSLSASQWVEFVGSGKYSSVISGSIAISNGVSIFRNLPIQADIGVSGGVAIFDNCSQTSGIFTLTGGTVIITNCATWGFIETVNDGATLFLEGIKNMKKGTGGDVANSIKFNAGITTGTYVFSDLRLEGVINNASAIVIEESNIRPNATARPTY